MYIALIVCIPVTALMIGLMVLKSVQIGLRWQMQAKEGKEPELKSVLAPITEAVQEHKADKQSSSAQELMNEWLNGEQKE